MGVIQGNSIRTYTGRYVDVWNLKEGDIVIEDIAHSLSLKCRYNGHVKYHYSVAEHCVRAANLVLYQSSFPEEAFAALLHDASEAYLVDLSSPQKKHPNMSEFRVLEERVEAEIARVFGFQYPYHPIVREVDDYLLHWEWTEYVTAEDPKEGWSPETARISFLNMFQMLTLKP